MSEEEKLYLYKDFPDKTSGRCDCGCSKFKSHVKDGKFIRECTGCGIKKII